MTNTPSATKADSHRQDVSVFEFGAVGDGIADDTGALRAALSSGARRVTVPAGTYLIRNVLEPEANQHLVINGTIRLADSEIQSLANDVAVGDSEIQVSDASRFAVGEWVTLHDDRLPIQGGGRKTRRQCAGNARIRSIDDNRLTLDQSSARSYLREAHAVVARQHAAIWIKHSGVRISGSGLLDGNKANHLDTAPGFLDQVNSEDWRTASGIVVSGSGMLAHITIEDITVCDFALHGICMRDAELCGIRNTTCLRVHDKNITLMRCRDTRISGNTCCDSEWEDGIMLHQCSGPEEANYRILIEGNICRNNPRFGVHVGANMREIHLANNLCVENGLNLSICGDNCTSTGDIATGTTDRLFTADVYRPNVMVPGRKVCLTNLTALGTCFVGVELSGHDLSLIGGVVGDMAEPPVESDNEGLHLADGEWGKGSGEFYVKGDSRFGLALVPGIRGKEDSLPQRVRLAGVRVNGCRVALKVAKGASDVSLNGNDLEGNAQPLDVPPQLWSEIEGADGAKSARPPAA